MFVRLLDRHFKTLVIGSLVLYFCLGMGFRIFYQEGVYPFFSWNLFSVIPNEQDGYTLRVISYGDETYVRPRRFDELTELFAIIRQSPTEYIPHINDLGYAIKRKNVSEVARLKPIVERIFFKTPARYEIVHVTFDPIEFWRSHTYTTEKVVATFDTAKAP